MTEHVCPACGSPWRNDACTNPLCELFPHALTFDQRLGRLDTRMDVRELIDRLTQRRRDAGVTQVELSARTGLKQQDISYFERRSTDPRVSTVVRYAAGLGIRLTLDAE